MQIKGRKKGGLLLAGVLGVILAVSGGTRLAQSMAPVPPEKANFPGGLSAYNDYGGKSDRYGAEGEQTPLPLAKPYRLLFSDVPTPTRKPVPAWALIPAGRLLDDGQDRLYREIFHTQAKGNFTAADAKIERLDNGILMGHVLAQRYLHPTAYRAKFRELKIWLDYFSDHPQAETIYALARKRASSDYTGHLERPKSGRQLNLSYASLTEHAARPYRSARRRSGAERAAINKLFRKIKALVGRERPTQAHGVLQGSKIAARLEEAELDQLRAQIAAGYFYAGKKKQAYNLAGPALSRSGDRAPMAGWVMGLIYWQVEKYSRAASAFESAARSPHASSWMMSAAAYWASRAHMRAGNVRAVRHWLERGATHPRTFYGLLSARALGQKFDFNWDIPPLSAQAFSAIESSRAGQRIQALIKAGQIGLAESELRAVAGHKKDLLLAYALRHNLPSLSLRLGVDMSDQNGRVYDSALYPVAPWIPASAYTVDPALIHAFIRQESRFKADVENPSGAAGLMQIMPATASYVSGVRGYSRKSGREALKEPQTNMRIGQDYIEKLLGHDAVRGDLLSLAIAYNAGPGNLSKWKRRQSYAKDPLFFIETIPYAETRAFVERVMANYWIYRTRFGQDTPSLDSVAKGRWTLYSGDAANSAKIASRVISGDSLSEKRSDQPPLTFANGNRESAVIYKTYKAASQKSDSSFQQGTTSFAFNN